MTNVFDGMEPLAIAHAADITRMTMQDVPGSIVATLSIAISLRRIADALAPAEGLRFGEQFGQDVGSNIQVAIGNALFEDWQRRG